jgi:hypothetical protein
MSNISIQSSGAFVIFLVVVLVGVTKLDSLNKPSAATSTPPTATPAASPPSERRTPHVGDRGTIEGTAFGCKTQADTDRIIRLISVEKDEEAADWLWREKQSARECRRLAAGEKVIVHDYGGILSPNICVRPVGDPNCLWTRGYWFKHEQP